MVCHRAAELSELQEKINMLTDKERAKNMKFQTILCLVAETTRMLKEVAKL